MIFRLSTWRLTVGEEIEWFLFVTSPNYNFFVLNLIVDILRFIPIVFTLAQNNLTMLFP